LDIGDLPQSTIPNPQSPIPNPQINYNLNKIKFINKYNFKYNIYKYTYIYKNKKWLNKKNKFLFLIIFIIFIFIKAVFMEKINAIFEIRRIVRRAF